MQKAILLKDMRSYCKGLKLYGLKGERVKIISIREGVAIVEGRERFAVRVDNLQLIN